jgi:hypothetical protein
MNEAVSGADFYKAVTGIHSVTSIRKNKEGSIRIPQ